MAAHHVALVDDCRNDAGRGQRCAGDDAGQPGMQREVHHHPTDVGQPAIRVDRSEHRQQLEALAPRPGRRRIGERQPVRRRAPGGQFQCESGEVDGLDLGRSVGQAAAVLDLRPQAVGDAWLGATGATGALVRRVAADRHRRQPRHPGAGVESWRPRESAVDDDADALDGERRLGDVGGEHDPSPPGRRRCQREVLVLERQRAGERPNVDVSGQRCNEAFPDPRDLADAWQEHEHVAKFVIERPLDGRRDGRFDSIVALPREPAEVDRMGAALADDDRCRTGVGREEPGERCRVGGGRHRDDPEVGPERRPDIEGQRESEVGREIAFVDLVEQHCRDARQFGVVLQAPRQHALGEHFDAGLRPDDSLVAGLVSDEITGRAAGQLRHPPRRRPRGQSTWLEHDDLSVAAPRRVEQRERHDGRLAGARRRARRPPGRARPAPSGGRRGSRRSGDRAAQRCREVWRVSRPAMRPVLAVSRDWCGFLAMPLRRARGLRSAGDDHGLGRPARSGRSWHHLSAFVVGDARRGGVHGAWRMASVLTGLTCGAAVVCCVSEGQGVNPWVRRTRTAATR